MTNKYPRSNTIVRELPDRGGRYPAYITEPHGVTVGPAGELKLVLGQRQAGFPTRMKIYAPGTWSEVSVEEMAEEAFAYDVITDSSRSNKT